MEDEEPVAEAQTRQPGILRRVGGFLSNVALLLLGAYLINWLMNESFPFEGIEANDVVGARQFLSSTASVCATLASFLLASVSFVASRRGSIGFVTLLKRGDFDLPMLGISIVFLITQALFCIYNLGLLTDSTEIDPAELADMVERTMNNTTLTISVLMLAIWSSVAPKAVNGIVYGIGKVKI